MQNIINIPLILMVKIMEKVNYREGSENIFFLYHAFVGLSCPSHQVGMLPD